ncbi:hypothetical protein [Stenotrophomonas sp. S39]|uniref:hypothetical protein n=1 Tax=Stenotrophomonas sp. S39 TaxID=2767451 RepID=UPI001909D5C7|nr:hypothetical protein [Stenotrophomonas sp. S39]MBK0056118.1 hypothetical protein [Stenotrophomonas sp. S39]
MLAYRLALLLCLPFAAQATASEKLSPEQAFDLYAQALLESNTQAAEALTRALPADAQWQTDTIRQLPRLLPEMHEQVFNQGEDEVVPAAVIEAVIAQITRTYASSRCRAVPGQAIAEAVPGGQAQVPYTCQVPVWNTESGLLADPAIQQKLQDDEVFAAYLIASELRMAEQQTITGTALLEGSAGTGYFPDGDTIRFLAPVLLSIFPETLADTLLEK